jgi:hypothetical protein
MPEEQNQESTSPDVVSNTETDALKSSIEALERKNHELIGELRQAKAVPDGVDIQELLEFKRQAEQSKLESEGKYTEARQALEQQFREASAEKDQRIAELEAKVRELELISPAVSALADIVHDPDLVLKTKLSADKIEGQGIIARVDAESTEATRFRCTIRSQHWRSSSRHEKSI